MPGEDPNPQRGEVSQSDIDAALAAAAFVAQPATASIAPPVESQEPANGSVTAAADALTQTHLSGGVFDDAASVMAAAIAEEKAAAAAGRSLPAKPLDLPDLGKSAGTRTDHGIDLLGDVELNVTIELGRATMLIEEVLRLGEGSVVELDKLAGDPVDVLVNERLVARGEVLVLNDNFCVRISEIVAGDAAAA